MNTIFVLILIIICIIFFISQHMKKQNVIENTNNINENDQIQGILNKTNNNNPINIDNKCKNEIMSKINLEILNKMGITIEDVENFLSSSSPKPSQMVEAFLANTKSIQTTTSTPKQIPPTISFKPIKSNRLYYGLPCDYIKNDCFYDSLKINNFVMTKNILEASLIVPCSYETTEIELVDLDKNKIQSNKYDDGVRIFMLNNTDHMVSKLALWKYLKQKYSADIASTMLPYTWDLTDLTDIELFKTQYDKNKIYITKNNNQRQEGIKIHTTLDSILNSKSKYLLVQELLQDPYLVSGRKINLRVYVLVIKDNYSNIKLNVYRDGFMYYTPELFEPSNPSFKTNITTGYVDRQIYIDNPLTHMDFRKWLDNPKRTMTQIEKYLHQTYPNMKISDYIFAQIYEQLGFIFKTYEDIIGTKTPGVCFQLYGVDVAINNQLNPIVMEINKGPDLTSKDGRDKDLKITLCTDVLKSVGLIPNVNNNFITVLEKVNIGGEYMFINNLVEH